MIRLIEALNFRCLRYARQPLKDFQVLIGPNASGKSTFLDAISFLGRLVSDGLEAAVDERTANFDDLLWGRHGYRFELAIEADIPEACQTPLNSPVFQKVRYEVAIGYDRAESAAILGEQLVLLGAGEMVRDGEDEVPRTLQSAEGDSRRKPLVSRRSTGQYLVSPEIPCNVDGEPDLDQEAYEVVIRPHPERTIFAGISKAEFPAATWLAAALEQSIQKVELESQALRVPSPPSRRRGLMQDGSGLPWMVSLLKNRWGGEMEQWLEHLRLVLPDLETIEVVEREEDKHRYLTLSYAGGLKVPGWMVSDGTLRVLALTIIPFICKEGDVWLVEEPEISIHPINIEPVMQSLQSVYEGQVLVATHSPTVLAIVAPEDILIFQSERGRGTRIVSGEEHHELREWHKQLDIGTLFASGVLG